MLPHRASLSIATRIDRFRPANKRQTLLILVALSTVPARSSRRAAPGSLEPLARNARDGVSVWALLSTRMSPSATDAVPTR